MDAMLGGAAGAVATALVWWSLRRLRVFAASRRAKRRARYALGRERDGEALLRREGYRIVERQARRRYLIHRDGQPMPVELRADYLVRRSGSRYVADVKTGPQAPRLRTPATRRQLLEYRVAYDVDGVLLVDMEAERVHCIDFALPTDTSPRRMGWLLALALGIVLGVGLGTSFTRHAASALQAVTGR
jgi:hypothetical protein